MLTPSGLAPLHSSLSAAVRTCVVPVCCSCHILKLQRKRDNGLPLLAFVHVPVSLSDVFPRVAVMY